MRFLSAVLILVSFFACRERRSETKNLQSANSSSDSELFARELQSQSLGRFKVKSEDINELQSNSCQEFLNYTYPTGQTDADMWTYGVIVIKDGKILLESYRNAESEKQLFKLYSVSKAITGLMVGALMEKIASQGEGRFDLSTRVWSDAPNAVNYVDLSRKPRAVFSRNKDGNENWRSQMRVRDLWTMGSGLQWCEYEGCAAIDPLRLMYGKANENNLAYIVDKPMIAAPGTRYQYSAGNYSLLQKTIQSAYKIHKLPGDPAFAAEDLIFRPLGISNYVFEKDGTGLPVGGSGAWLNLKDFAKVGKLILNHGTWDGNRIFSENFYTDMTTLSEPIKSSGTPKEVKLWEGPHGGSLWLNRQYVKDGKVELPIFLPNSPPSVLYAAGKFGKFLLMYPEQNMIVARIGADRNTAQHWDKFSSLAMSCFSPKTSVEKVRTDAIAVAPESSYSELASSIKGILNERLVSRMMALEVCNCMNLTNASADINGIEGCKRLSPLPNLVETYLKIKVTLPVINSTKIVKVESFASSNWAYKPAADTFLKRVFRVGRKPHLDFLMEPASTVMTTVFAPERKIGSVMARFDPSLKHQGCKLDQYID